MKDWDDEHSMSTLELVGSISDSSIKVLRECLLRCYSSFQTYREVFEELGISRADIVEGDPLAILQSLPLLQGERFVALMDESLEVGERIVDLETSSGTMGPRSRRFISSEDDASDHELLAKMFGVFGIGPEDRVACLDVDPVNLMVSFTKALDLLGVQESYAYCAGPDFTAEMASLRALDPTVIVTIPSIVERCFESLKLAYAAAHGHLQKVVYFGEPPSRATRRALELNLGVEVFGYYGATETSSLGAECSAHDGIHVFTDHNVIEVAKDDVSSSTGEIVVTSLKQRTLPLLRYALRDEIAVRSGPCACGLDYPRIEVVGRADDSFSILGLKVHYAPVLDAVYEQADSTGLMQLEVTRHDKEALTIVLPDRLRGLEDAMRRTVLDRDRELEFLVRGGYLGLTFSFVDEGYFSGTRKVQRVVDDR